MSCYDSFLPTTDSMSDMFLQALHVAAFYGEEDIVRELMRHVPPSVKSEMPSVAAVSLVGRLGFDIV